MSKLSQFAQFASRYYEELRLFAQLARMLKNNFMEHDQKERLDTLADQFEERANSVEKSIGKIKEATETKYKPADIQAAIRKEAPELLSLAVAELAKNKPETPAT